MKFLRNNFREILLTIVLLVAFRLWPMFWQTFIDPQSAASDSGIVHLLIFGSLAAAFILTTGWVLLYTFFPSVDEWAEFGGFRAAFAELRPHQQIATMFALVAFFAWLIVRCAELAK